jgi:predicted permease
VLLFTGALAVTAGLGTGLLPALRSSRSDPVGLLASRGAARGAGVLGQALVAAQVGIAVVLLTGAGLLLKSFVLLRGVPVGLDPDRVLTLRLAAPESRYPDRPAVTSFYARLLERVRALPGVEAAGAGNGLPLAVFTGDWSFDVEGRPRAMTKHHGAMDWFTVTPGYFEALRVPLVRGRLPGAGDGEQAPPVVFVNEAAARTFFPGEDPVGRRVLLSRGRGSEQPWRTIAGVVADVRQRSLDRPPAPAFYLPHAQFQHFMAGVQARDMSVVVKTTGEPRALAAAVRAQLRSLDPEVPAAQVRTMDEVMAGALADRRPALGLMVSFGALALLLATVGLYGVMSFHVSQRAREVGVRVALGAARADVLRLVVGQGMRLVQAGLAAGLLLALAAGGALRGLLYGVGTRDLTVLAAISAILASTGLFASYLPARRATAVDAAAALRQD